MTAMADLMNDHDLLITIHTQLQRALADIDALRQSLDGDKLLSRVEATHVVAELNKLHSDHERRLRRLETYGAYAVGIIGFIQILGGIVSFIIRLQH